VALVGSACPVAAAAASPVRPDAAAHPADGGCVVDDVAGQVTCSDVGNDTLNDLSIHILGH